MRRGAGRTPPDDGRASSKRAHHRVIIYQRIDVHSSEVPSWAMIADDDGIGRDGEREGGKERERERERQRRRDRDRQRQRQTEIDRDRDVVASERDVKELPTYGKHDKAVLETPERKPYKPYNCSQVVISTSEHKPYEY